MQTIPPLPFLQQELTVATLGPATVPSPLGLSTTPGDDIADYVPDDARVLYDVETRAGVAFGAPVLFEKAGPREHIYFEPHRARAALVTCGGLCPGLNNVLRSMVLELHHKYRVASVLGFRYGYEGLDPSTGAPPTALGPGDVTHIHRHGGSVLGLSRGKREVPVMVDTLVRERVDVLFTIGGDGTLRGAHAIAEEIARRGAPIAVVGVPKTIDNDVELVDRTFGFDTAVEVARTAIDAAHTEALGAYNGVGIVKLMGRDAGFIAAAATIASREVNFCLVPEVRFDLEGPAGLLGALEKRLAERQHAVIVVAEGCGAALASGGAERDASGNVRYASAEADIGPYLRDLVTSHLKSRGVRATVKYIDPSYMIRSVPANASDSIFCDSLARNAVHAGMAGKTDMVVGRIHGVFTHVPLSVVAGGRKRVNPDGGLWLAVTEATGQGRLWSGGGA